MRESLEAVEEPAGTRCVATALSALFSGLSLRLCLFAGPSLASPRVVLLAGACAGALLVMWSGACGGASDTRRSTAGLFSRFFTHPLDTVKARLQVQAALRLRVRCF